MNDRSMNAPGHAYYVTTVVYGRLPIFTKPATIISLFDSLNYYRTQLNFRLLGYVVMPDHVHLLIWPQQKADVTSFLRSFKTITSKRIVRQAEAERRHGWLTAFERGSMTTGRGMHKVWQDSSWNLIVFSDRFVRQKLNYMHRNPVRAGLVNRPEDYPYSSYRSYVFDEEWLVEIDRGWS